MQTAVEQSRRRGVRPRMPLAHPRTAHREMILIEYK